MRPSITHYSLGSAPASGVGIGVAADELNAALSSSVANTVFDDFGMGAVRELLGGLADTEFVRDNLNALLNEDAAPEDWRIGEAIAECYLTENRECHFPWPDGRDERKRGSSLPGADLVGFQRENGEDRFAFGEVKTSSHAAYPPGTVFGRHGLKQQMEDLRDKREIRDGLVRYLGHRAINSTWRDRYETAGARYLRNTSDVRLHGILVRDVPPNQDDLRVRVQKLAVDCPPATVIELTAIYLPSGRIPTLANSAVDARRNRGAT